MHLVTKRKINKKSGNFQKYYILVTLSPVVVALCVGIGIDSVGLVSSLGFFTGGISWRPMSLFLPMFSSFFVSLSLMLRFCNREIVKEFKLFINYPMHSVYYVSHIFAMQHQLRCKNRSPFMS